MREQVHKPENTSRTIQSNSRASKQAPISEILQAYKDRIEGKPVRRQSVDEEELLQAKAAQQDHIRAVLQRYKDNIQRSAPQEDEELIQGKFDTAQREIKPNNTGLPDNLKTGIENLSGYSMDDVKVHYNSDKPAQLRALAYAQGTDIHVAPGQEKHLPHEAWHVVQQKQGRVQPTMQLQRVNVNDNEGLEKEADVMGGSLRHSSNNLYASHSTVIQGKFYRSNKIYGAEDKEELKGKLLIAYQKLKKYKITESEFVEQFNIMYDEAENHYYIQSFDLTAQHIAEQIIRKKVPPVDVKTFPYELPSYEKDRLKGSIDDEMEFDYSSAYAPSSPYVTHDDEILKVFRTSEKIYEIQIGGYSFTYNPQGNFIMGETKEHSYEDILSKIKFDDLKDLYTMFMNEFHCSSNPYVVKFYTIIFAAEALGRSTHNATNAFIWLYCQLKDNAMDFMVKFHNLTFTGTGGASLSKNYQSEPFIATDKHIYEAALLKRFREIIQCEDTMGDMNKHIFGYLFSVFKSKVKWTEK